MPTAWVYCIPVAEERGKIFNRGTPQWQGIWRPQEQSSRGQHAFVAGPADLEVYFVLALELDFAVVDSARKIHGAINTKKVLPGQTLVLGGVKFRRFGACLNRHAIAPRAVP